MGVLSTCAKRARKSATNTPTGTSLSWSKHNSAMISIVFSRKIVNTIVNASVIAGLCCFYRIFIDAVFLLSKERIRYEITRGSLFIVMKGINMRQYPKLLAICLISIYVIQTLGIPSYTALLP